MERAKRTTGPDVWVFRYRETAPDRTRVARKRVVGTVVQYPTLSKARAAVDHLRVEINAAPDHDGGVRAEKATVGSAWGHFLKHELRSAESDRSPTTCEVYENNFRQHILPRWLDVELGDVKPVAVQQWLRSLSHLSPGTKAKLRNQMSCLFSHALRHELYVSRDGGNPMRLVRQSSKTLSIPDNLTLDEIRHILSHIHSDVAKLMVMVGWTLLDLLRRGLPAHRADRLHPREAAARRPGGPAGRPADRVPVGPGPHRPADHRDPAAGHRPRPARAARPRGQHDRAPQLAVRG